MRMAMCYLDGNKCPAGEAKFPIQAERNETHAWVVLIASLHDISTFFTQRLPCDPPNRWRVSPEYDAVCCRAVRVFTVAPSSEIQ